MTSSNAATFCAAYTGAYTAEMKRSSSAPLSRTKTEYSSLDCRYCRKKPPVHKDPQSQPRHRTTHLGQRLRSRYPNPLRARQVCAKHLGLAEASECHPLQTHVILQEQQLCLQSPTVPEHPANYTRPRGRPPPPAPDHTPHRGAARQPSISRSSLHPQRRAACPSSGQLVIRLQPAVVTAPGRASFPEVRAVRARVHPACHSRCNLLRLHTSVRELTIRPKPAVASSFELVAGGGGEPNPCLTPASGPPPTGRRSTCENLQALPNLHS